MGPGAEAWFRGCIAVAELERPEWLEEVDREAGKTQEDMPTLEMPYSELQGRFRPGYCAHVSGQDLPGAFYHPRLVL